MDFENSLIYKLLHKSIHKNALHTLSPFGSYVFKFHTQGINYRRLPVQMSTRNIRTNLFISIHMSFRNVYERNNSYNGNFFLLARFGDFSEMEMLNHDVYIV